MSSPTEFTLASLIEGICITTGSTYQQAIQQLRGDLTVLSQRASDTNRLFPATSAAVSDDPAPGPMTPGTRPPVLALHNLMVHRLRTNRLGATQNVSQDQGTVVASGCTCGCGCHAAAGFDRTMSLWNEGEK